MRISDIISMGKEYVILGFALAMMLLVLYLIGYHFVYRKLLHGEKKIQWKKLIWKFILVVYLMVMLGATLLGRFDGWEDGIVRPLLYSYKEAWYSGRTTEWRNLILNIAMFVPFGILVPMAFPKMRSFGKTYLAGIITTGSIEFIQFIFHRGICEWDDIMNNFIGTMIGYGLLVFIMKLFQRKKLGMSWRRILVLQIPLLLTIVVFAGLKIRYDQMEIGTLTCHYIEKLKIDKQMVQAEVNLSDEEQVLPVYKIKILSEADTKQTASNFFENLGVKIDPSRDDIYTETAIYHSDNNGRYTMSIDYKGGVYRFIDFSVSFPEDGREVNYNTNASEIEIRKALLKYSVDVPDTAIFVNCGDGKYRFTADATEDASGQMYNGNINCEYTKEGEFTQITNQMMQYEAYKDFTCISEQQAFDELSEGKYRGIAPVNELKIKNVAIQYKVDSKGYVQPVYAFDDGDATSAIYIPAVK